MIKKQDKSRMKKLSAALILLLVVFALAGCGKKGAASESKSLESAAEGQNKSEAGVFESLKTTDLDGKSVDNSIFAKNKLTLVNVWGTGCAPCVAEMPELQKISEKYKAKKVGVIGVVYDTLNNGNSKAVQKKVNAILKRAGTKYRQLTISKEMNGSSDISDITALPTTFFLDSKGKILEKMSGSGDYAEWSKRIDEVLKKVK